MSTLLKASNLSHQYSSDINLFKDLSFELSLGESLGIIGPNGSGKTTLLKILAGIIKPTCGNIEFKKEHKISYIAQRNTFNSSLPLSGLEILELHCSDKSAIKEVIDLVELKEKINFQFENLSGGEKQRVLIAQAIISRPKILILDEPNKGLDSAGQDQLLSILKKSLKQNEMGIIMVDHNINQTLNFCTKILCLGNNTHWHDKKELLDINVLNSIYHCEFEHQLIHMDPKNWGKDHKCDGDHE